MKVHMIIAEISNTPATTSDRRDPLDPSFAFHTRQAGSTDSLSTPLLLGSEGTDHINFGGQSAFTLQRPQALSGPGQAFTIAGQAGASAGDSGGDLELRPVGPCSSEPDHRQSCGCPPSGVGREPFLGAGKELFWPTSWLDHSRRPLRYRFGWVG